MPAETTFAKIKYSLAADETKAFPAEVSAPGAKTIDKFLEEHTLTLKKRAASYEAKSGEWGLQESSAKTVTLPLAATASQPIAVTSAVAEAKVTTSGGAVIYGKWLTVGSATATVVLTTDMTAFFFSDGTNWILGLGSEIKDERKYGVAVFATKAEAEAGIEPSTTRPAMITMEVSGGGSGTVAVGGVVLGSEITSGAYITFLCPAGIKWKSTLQTTYNVILL